MEKGKKPSNVWVKIAIFLKREMSLTLLFWLIILIIMIIRGFFVK